MNKELLERWVAALRSGEYEQGTGKLRRLDSVADCTRYCCLGVLQAIEPSIKERGSRKELLDCISLFDHMGGNIEQQYLAEMNDEGITFPEIADYIEKKYLNNEEDK